MPTNYPTKTDRRMTTGAQRRLIAAIAARSGVTEAARISGRPYLTCYTICKRLGVTPKPHHPPTPPERIKAAHNLRKQGHTLKAIGAALNVSYTQVRNWLIDVKREAA